MDDHPERRLRAVPPRRAEDRRVQTLTEVFRSSWEHGVEGQAQVIAGMQKIIYSYTVLADPDELSHAIADVRWLVAEGVRRFQRMLGELETIQSGLVNNAPADDEPL